MKRLGLMLVFLLSFAILSNLVRAFSLQDIITYFSSLFQTPGKTVKGGMEDFEHEPPESTYYTTTTYYYTTSTIPTTSSLKTTTSATTTTTTTTTTITPLPDLSISSGDISYSVFQDSLGTQLNLRFIIHNLGNTASSSPWITVYDNNVSADVFNPNEAIPAGGQINTGFGYYPSLGIHNIRVVIDPNNNIAESNENNNIAEKTIAVTTSTITTTTIPPCGYGTATASSPVTYNNVKFYAVQGATSWAKIQVRDQSGNILESLTINSGESKDTTSSSIFPTLRIKVFNVDASPDGTVNGASLGIGYTEAWCGSCISGTATATSGVVYGGDYIIYSSQGSTNSWALIVVNKGGPTIQTKIVNQGDSWSLTDQNIKIKVVNVRALQDGTIVGVDLIVGPTQVECSYPSKPVMTLDKSIYYRYETAAASYSGFNANEVLKTTLCRAGGGCALGGTETPSSSAGSGIHHIYMETGYDFGNYTFTLSDSSGKSASAYFALVQQSTCEDECKKLGYNYGVCGVCGSDFRDIGINNCPQPVYGTKEGVPSCSKDVAGCVIPTHHCCCSYKKQCPYECCENDLNYLDKSCSEATSCSCACPIGVYPCPPCACPPPVKYVCTDHRCVPETFKQTITFYSGWNMFSNPVNAPIATSEFFKTATTPCTNDFDCPEKMKCKTDCQANSTCPEGASCAPCLGYCVDVGCLKAGEGTHCAISPEGFEQCKHMATECCPGLKSIAETRQYDENCSFVPIIGVTMGVCSDCGNGICESWESKCTCPQDCSITTTTTTIPSGGGGVETSEGVVLPISPICTFDNIIGKIWHYSNGKYEEVSLLNPGEGYWVKMKTQYYCFVQIEGKPVVISDFPTLNAGWNQIGSPSESVQFSTVVGNCKVAGGPWKYNAVTKQYEKSDYLMPGIGYWVNVESQCKLGESETPPLPPVLGSIIGKILGQMVRIGG